jgi:hypothetical protein
MVARYIASLLIVVTVLVQPASQIAAQETDPHIRVVVNLVQLNVAVTDDKGNYITGLRHYRGWHTGEAGHLWRGFGIRPQTGRSGGARQ